MYSTIGSTQFFLFEPTRILVIFLRGLLIKHPSRSVNRPRLFLVGLFWWISRLVCCWIVYQTSFNGRSIDHNDSLIPETIFAGRINYKFGLDQALFYYIESPQLITRQSPSINPFEQVGMQVCGDVMIGQHWRSVNEATYTRIFVEQRRSHFSPCLIIT